MTRAILQNKRRNFAGLMIASVFALAACGGGGGGGDHGGGGGGLATGTFTRTVDFGGGATYTGLTDAAPYTRYQYLYLVGNMNGAGRISSLALRYSQDMTAAVTCPNTTIKLSHSNLAALTATFASNLGTGQGSQTTVVNDSTMTFPAGAAGTWQTITLATPFDYNGVDNLIMDVERTGACTGNVFDSANFVAYTGAVYTEIAASPTGSLGSFVVNIRFVFAGGDNKVDFGGTNIAAHSNSFPWSANKRTQHLYLASEINGSGPITGIAFQANFQNTVAATYTYTLRLGHTTLSTLGITFDSNFSGSPTTVANAVANFSIPAGIPPGEWFWVPIPAGVFSYNGTDNLVVEVSVPAGTDLNYVRKVPGFTGRRLFNVTDAAAATGTVNDDAYHIALRFNGGTMNVIEPNLATYAIPFQSAASVIQAIYGSHVMGTSGPINKVSLRLTSDNAADVVYTGAAITLGHTTLANLTPTLASNMDDPTVVFSGNITIPAGLKAGDWFDIPVSGFTYNPTKNLTLQLQAGTGPSPVSLTYGGSGVISNTGAATPGSATMDGGFEGLRHPHLKLSVSK